MNFAIINYSELTADRRLDAAMYVNRPTPYQLAKELISALDTERVLSSVGRATQNDAERVKEAVKRWDHRSSTSFWRGSPKRRGWQSSS